MEQNSKGNQKYYKRNLIIFLRTEIKQEMYGNRSQNGMLLIEKIKNIYKRRNSSRTIKRRSNV